MTQEHLREIKQIVQNQDLKAEAKMDQLSAKLRLLEEKLDHLGQSKCKLERLKQTNQTI